MTNPLRAYRLENGITLGELSRRIGVSKPSLSRIETGKQVPSLSLLKVIATETGGRVMPNDFLPTLPDASQANSGEGR